MEHNNLPKELISEIEIAVKQIREDYDMVNQVPKEDIFALLEKLCTVLYYPCSAYLVWNYGVKIIGRQAQYGIVCPFSGGGQGRAQARLLSAARFTVCV